MTNRGSILIAIFGLVVVSQISVLHAGDAVPVLIWGTTNLSPGQPAVNPFVKTSSEEFTDILEFSLGTSKFPVIVFVKKNLCIEYVTQHKKELQELTRGVSLRYIPAIDKPLTVLENLYGYNQTEDDDIDSLSEGQIVIKYVNNFDAIAETYKAAKESMPNVVGILTGNSCSFARAERTKREAASTAAPAAGDSYFLVYTDKVLLYSSQWPLVKINNEETQLTAADFTGASSNGTGEKDKPLFLHMEFNKSGQKFAIDLVFLMETEGYYTLTHADYSTSGNQEPTDLKTDRNIVFPSDFSYHCAQNVVFQKENTNFNFTDIQVQIDATTFGDAYDCVGFTTIPIWTGIFVTAILALIMIWALTMIIDIRTMDRFDDPKGKTITISTLE